MIWVEYVRVLEPHWTRLVEQAEALVRRLDTRFPSLPEMYGDEAFRQEEDIRGLKLRAFYRLKRRECALYRSFEAMRSQLQMDRDLGILEDDGYDNDCG